MNANAFNQPGISAWDVANVGFSRPCSPTRRSPPTSAASGGLGVAGRRRLHDRMQGGRRGGRLVGHRRTGRGRAAAAVAAARARRLLRQGGAGCGAQRVRYRRVKCGGDTEAGWDVSQVDNMKELDQKSSFNGDIPNWDIHRVTTLYSAFVARPASPVTSRSGIPRASRRCRTGSSPRPSSTATSRSGTSRASRTSMAYSRTLKAARRPLGPGYRERQNFGNMVSATHAVAAPPPHRHRALRRISPRYRDT